MMRREQNNELDSIDRLGQEIVQAVRVGDEEVDATAGSPDLYRRVQLQIAARRDPAAYRKVSRRTQNPILSLLRMRGRAGWAFASVVALLSLVIIIGLLLRRPVEQSSSGQQAAATKSETIPDGGGGGVQAGKSPTMRGDVPNERPA